MIGVKFHIAFRRMDFQKERFGHPKIQFSSKVAKFAGKIAIDLTLIFCMNDFFCAILSFWDKNDFVFFPSGLIRNLIGQFTIDTLVGTG